MQPSEAVDKIHSSFPPSLLSKYSWGIRKKAGLPYGFIFLKRKKQWQKGRTLISYFQSFQGKLLKAVSKALGSMLQQQWTQTAGQLSTSQIWKKIHSFLQDTPAEIMLGCINDDLIGFSTPSHKNDLCKRFPMWYNNGVRLTLATPSVLTFNNRDMWSPRHLQVATKNKLPI